ncbi:hypothetical protein AB0C65_10175 [Nocardia sp. NPDC048505]|uniref:hypothetical protein n=1 Tax=Nocardia sp. NPDC048505 TaxID=3155756 RepID=UPI0033E5C7B1
MELFSYLAHELEGYVISENSDSTESEIGSSLQVWGLALASEETREFLLQWCNAREISLREGDPIDPSMGRQRLSLETKFRSDFRAEFKPGSSHTRIAVPVPPWDTDKYGEFYPGSIAAQVSVHSELGQDPRLTVYVPPYRQHSELMAPRGPSARFEVGRSTSDGLVFLLQAHTRELQIPFIFNQDGIRLLFAGDDISVGQSSDGQFQSRTAEMLGGPFQTFMRQPAAREALRLLASKPAGLPLQHLRSIFRYNNTNWPDLLLVKESNKFAFADQQLNRLLNSGLAVPFLDVHCSFCRVVSQVHPKDLAAVVECQYCGENIRLALALSLSKSNWNFKLAGHLPSAKVEAMLPVLATLSVIADLEPGGSSNFCHFLGAELTVGESISEMDVVIVMRMHGPHVILGEVKNSNKINETDILNVEAAQRRLRENGVSSIALFATLKERFSADEVLLLRAFCERAPERKSTVGAMPNFPLLLTGPDMSLPELSEENPWRWGEPGHGISGTILESCKRNLGLKSLVPAIKSSGHAMAKLEWESD